MIGSKGTVIVFAFVGLLNFGRIGALPNHDVYEVTCPKVDEETEENILFAHESDCTKFYQCSFEVKYEHSCPSDLHFSEEAKRCEWPEIANCKININTCPQVEENPPIDILLPHETDCTKFYKCSFGKKVEFDCPEGLHFNPKKQYCDWPGNAKCKLENGKDNSTNGETSCTLNQESQLFPHKTDCNKFYICNFGKKVERPCPAGLHFSVKANRCEWPNIANCESGNGNGNSTTGEDSCSLSQESHLFPHKTDCNKFYICNFGKKVERPCPAGLHFSVKANRCEWPNIANCESGNGNGNSTTGDDSCSQSQESHLFPHKTDCNKFYICNFGKKLERPCPAGLHFSVKANRCEWPNIANCESGNGNGNSTTGDDSCSQSQESHLFPHKTDCNKFYICNFGKKVERPCPAGLHFSVKANRCEWPNIANCESGNGNGNSTTGDDSCSQSQESHLFPHKTDCNKFYICNFGKKVERPCPAGLHFSVKANRCEWPNIANCESGNGNGNSTTGDDSCSQSQESHLFPHKTDCNKFYICNFGKKVERPCPAGLHFSVKANRCEWPNIANCESGNGNGNSTTGDDSCSQSQESHLFPHKTDCNKFYICNFGKKVERPCPAGLHFSVKANRCEWPNIANCESGNGNGNSTTGDDSCSQSQESHLFPHKTDCNKFYICNFGKKVERPCPAGLHFSVKANRCEWPNIANCESGNGNGNSTTGDDSCSQSQESHLFPHKTDCNKFYICNFGKKVERPCPAGLHFSVKANRCEWPNIANCKSGNGNGNSTTGEGSCSLSEESQLYPHKTDCNKFYICNHGEKVERPCPAGLHFSVKANRCEWPNIANCESGNGNGNSTTGEGSCSPSEESQLFPHKTDCNKFYICNHGNKVERPCPAGLHFSVKANRCEWPNIANCESGNGNGNSTTGEGSCSLSEESQLYPHKTDCNKFYICNHGEKVERPCAAGLHFSVKANRCEWPNIANCESGNGNGNSTTGEGSCSPSEESQLYPHKTDCNKFYICNHGKKVERSCPAGLHFSVKANRCEWPDIANCKSGNGNGNSTTGEGSCSLSEESQLYPHKTDCNKFYICNHGEKVERPCPAGLHFSVKANRCEWPNIANCESGNGNGNSTTGEGSCSPSEESQLYPHKTDCNKFYICNHGNKVERPCPAGLHFSVKANKCEWPNIANCESGNGNGNSTTGEGSCSLSEESQLYPHKTDCNKFYICNHGEKVERPCPAGLHFSVKANRCEWPNIANCESGNGNGNSTTGEGSCSPSEESQLYPHKTDCNKFYICNHGKKVERPCPAGLHFSVKANRCEWPDIANCKSGNGNGNSTTGEGSCSLSEESQLYPHKTDCNKFYICNHGEKVERPCPAGLHFSVKANRCEWPNIANCESGNGNGNSTTGEGSCSPSEESQLYPHKTDCNKFYICNHGKKVERPCPAGLHFSVKANRCEWPDIANCKSGNGNGNSTTGEGSCSLSEESQLYPHKTDCNKFYICNHGEKVERPCPAGLHFSVKANRCDWPNIANCESGNGNGNSTTGEGSCSPSEESQLYPHKTDCNKFYICNHGNKVERPCPAGLHFSVKANRCEWPNIANCESGNGNGNSTTGEGSCSLSEESQLYPHKTDCNKFYICNHGEKVERPCPAGLHFSVKANRCEWPNIANCESGNGNGNSTTGEGSCSPSEESQLYPHKTDCNKFYICNHGKKVERPCPAGLHFSVKANRCEWPDIANCKSGNGNGNSTTGEGSCSLSEESQLYPHKTDCNKFYICNHGEKVERPCPAGLHFSVKANRCEWPNIANCESGNGNGNSTTGEGSCSPSEESQLYPHKTDCNKFYICNHGKKVERKCPAGLHFSVKANRCEWPDIANCKSGNGNGNSTTGEGSCSLSEESQLYLHKTDCNKFYICNHGKKVERPCPAGLHFSVKANRCEWPGIANCKSGNGNGNSTAGEDSCSLSQESQLYPHKSICNKYYICSHGKRVERPCPAGLHFSVKANRCEWPRNAHCEANSDNECPQVTENPKEDILFPHESDCTKFYKCSFGVKILKDCGKGLHYNPKEQYCDWPQNAKCKLEPPSEESCSDEEEKNLYPHKSDCNKFYQCILGKVKEYSCVKNQHFDPERKVCDWPHNVNCKINLNVTSCPMVEENPEEDILLPHESDCTKFYKCNFGEKVVIPCPSGLHFNVAERYCDWPRLAKCDPDWGRENSTNSTGSCPNVEEDPKIDILLPHETDCTLFYKCNFGNKVLMDCPDDLHFNEEKQFCDYPDQANCKTNVPTIRVGFSKIKEWKSIHDFADTCPDVEEDPEEDILIPHESDCSKFYKCSLGNKIEQDCVAGLHFNPETNNCDWPENVNCSQASLYLPAKIIKEQNNVHNFVDTCPDVEEDPEEDILIPHESDCSKFYKCSLGNKIEQDCVAGLHFNPETNNCDWPENVNCSQSSFNLLVKIIKEQNNVHKFVDTCPDVEEDPEEDILIPHESDCSKFYKCSLGNKIEQDCVAGLHFNPETNNCDWPENVNCSQSSFNLLVKIIKEQNNVHKFVDTCPDVEEDPEEDILIPHESDCSKFYKCSLGNKIEQDCVAGLHFNPETNNCDWPENVNCSQASLYLPAKIIKEQNNVHNFVDTCPDVEEDPEEDILIPHESDCSKFYKCSLGNKIEQDCVAGLHFNPETNNCDWPENVNCSQASFNLLAKIIKEQNNVHNFVDTCPDVEEDPEEDILIPHESDCSKFYKCSLGNKIEQDCVAGLHFNPETNNCDWPENVNCSQASLYLPAKIIKEQNNVHNFVDTCPDVEEDPEEDILIPHESDCSKFYKCSLGNKIEQDCVAGLHFNPETNNCDWPENVKCSQAAPYLPAKVVKEQNNAHNFVDTCPDVEEDPEEDILLPHESDCSKFYKCSLGNKIEQDCVAGLHFNPETNNCDWPENVNCSQASFNLLAKIIKEQNNVHKFVDTCPDVEEDPEEDILIPHESDCSKFYKCSLGSKIEQDCPAGLHFNPETKNCDWPENAKCSHPALFWKR